MEIDAARFQYERDQAKSAYALQPDIWCPYFGEKIVLNSDGFHHLQYSSRRERSKREQLLKFRLLPIAIQVIRKTGTVQEYRRMLAPVGKPKRDGSVAMKEIEYWAFTAITGENKLKTRTIVRRVGDGKLIFWSVMPDSKWKNGQQKLHDDGIEDEE